MDAEDDKEDAVLPTWKKILTNSWVATIVVLIPSFALMKVGYAKIWPLFGSANQLLAVLALSAVAVFLKKTNKDNKMMFFPMFFMIAVTFVALIQIVIKQVKTIIAPTAVSDNLAAGLQLVFAILLLALAIIVVVQCCQKLFEKENKKEQATC